MRPLVLLFGASGRLGRAIASHPSFAAYSLKCFAHADCDAADRQAVEAVFDDCCRTQAPAAVVNAAGFTDVALAQKLRRTRAGREQVLRANALVPEVLAAAAAGRGAAFLHISTDYVFSGGGLKAHRPQDRPRPEGFYGYSKYLGERAVERTYARTPLSWAVLRIGWVHGAPGDFVEKVLDAALAGRLKTMRSDQWGVPTSYDAAAAACGEVLSQLLARGAAPLGACHYAESGPFTNRFRLTQRILARAAEETARRAEATSDEKKRSELQKVSARFSFCALKLKGFRVHDPARPANCRLLCGQVKFEKLSDCYLWKSSVDNSVDNFLRRRGM